jgi:hypothetical protein
MLLRVLKERWNADDTPMLDESRPHRPQLVNGGSVVVVNPATGLPENFLPGELLDVPDKVGKDLLINSPQSVEPESHHQARLGRFRARDAERESERMSLAARMRELSHQTEQAQKLRHMAEERERTLAAENLRVAQNAAGKDSIIEEMRRQMAEVHATYAAKLAELEARLTAPAAPPAEPIDPPAEKSTRKKAGG